LQSP